MLTAKILLYSLLLHCLFDERRAGLSCSFDMNDRYWLNALDTLLVRASLYLEIHFVWCQQSKAYLTVFGWHWGVMYTTSHFEPSFKTGL